MGQRELMLVLLVTIIAGAATLVAIDTFQKSRDTASSDAIRQDMATAAAEAGKYYRMPTSIGGGGGSFSNITFKDLTIDSSNQNGSYTLSGSGNTLVITGSDSLTSVNVELTATMQSDGDLSLSWKEL